MTGAGAGGGPERPIFPGWVLNTFHGSQTVITDLKSLFTL
jgi:hypothetical protein